MPATVTADTRALVYARAGYRCEFCGIGMGGPLGFSLQHRRPRGMGGTRRAVANVASNLLLLCGSATTGHHGQAERRDASMHRFGYWLKPGEDPADTPVWLFTGEWVLLTDSGLYLPCPAPSQLTEGVS